MKAAAVLDLPELLTTAELAVLLKVNRSTVSRWRSVGAYVSGRTFDTRRDAQAWLAREQAALAGGVDPRAGRSTCRTLSECCYWMVELRGLRLGGAAPSGHSGRCPWGSSHAGAHWCFHSIRAATVSGSRRSRPARRAT